MASVLIGDELKDSFKPTLKWVNGGIDWLSDVEEFYRERATIEKEYAAKLKDLCKRHFEKKSKIATELSVGKEPKVTPGSLESASMVLWSDVLTQTEAIADEKLTLHRELNVKIGDNVVLLKGKCAKLSRHIESIDEYLTNEKTSTEEELLKARKNYYSVCQSTENVRQKTEKSSSDKYQRKLLEKEVDMNIAKNQYLLKINVANRLKDKYYYQDLPELLDYFQEVNEARVAILNKLIKNASIVERNSHDRIKEKLHLIDKTVDQNNPTLDTAMFVKHNSFDWKEPEDNYFIPSDIWHDDESLVTKEPELTELKKILNHSSSEFSKYESLALDTKQKLEEATIQRHKDQESITLKFDGSFSTSLSILQRFMKDDTQRVKSEVEIEVIQNYAGDKDLSHYEETKKKKSRFGFLKGGKQQGNGGSDVTSIHTVKSVGSHDKSGFLNLRRNKTKSSMSSSGPTAKALYPYEAAGDDETGMVSGEVMEILEFDDGSGWTSVKLSGGQGLVPTSYLEILDDGGKKKGPSVPPKRGARRDQYVEALYDYQADGDDEISIRAGDRIAVIQDDTDGSGWTEGEINGERGMFPTSYVKKI